MNCNVSHISKRLGLLALLTSALGGQAQGVFMYGTTMGSSTTPSTLVQLDPTDGSLIQEIGSVGYAVNGLEWANGKLYGSTSYNDLKLPSGLIEIDPITGAGTPIGTGFAAGDLTVVCITSDSLGRLFGWIEPNSDDLALIDTDTGLASRVGESNLSTGTLGLAFDANDNLFLVNSDRQAYSINSSTGASTYLHELGTTAHHGDFNPIDGYYYGITDTFSTPRTIVVASLTTTEGRVIRYMNSIENLHAVTFAPVPEPADAALCAGLVTLGSVLIRRWFVRR